MSFSLRCRFFKKGKDGKIEILDEGLFDNLKPLCDYSYSPRLCVEWAEGNDFDWANEFFEKKEGDYAIYDSHSFISKQKELKDKLIDLERKIEKLKELETSVEFFKLSGDEKDDYCETVENLSEEKSELESQISACDSVLALFDWVQGKSESWNDKAFVEVRAL